MRMSNFRKVMGLAAAVLMIGASGCDDTNDGGASPLHLYFSTSNIHECMPITVTVDLVAAGAAVAERGDGSLECEIDPALASLGCTGTFELTDVIGKDDTLMATIDGCEVSAEASLFDCEFSEGSAESISSNVDSVCGCVGEPECDWNIWCLRRPETCVSETAGPHACEDCFNHVDDDGDGFVDCNDANCYVVDCGFGQTTITCSTTSTTTTSTLLAATGAADGDWDGK